MQLYMLQSLRTFCGGRETKAHFVAEYILAVGYEQSGAS